jgi:hypothetical protein
VTVVVLVTANVPPTCATFLVEVATAICKDELDFEKDEPVSEMFCARLSLLELTVDIRSVLREQKPCERIAVLLSYTLQRPPWVCTCNTAHQRFEPLCVCYTTRWE